MAEQDIKSPDRWEPGVDVDSEEKYDRFTEQLARDLLTDCTPEHISVIAAQHIMYVDCLSRYIDELCKVRHISGELSTLRLEQAELRHSALHQHLEHSIRTLAAYRRKIGRPGAKARHAETNLQKAKALSEWDAHGANVSSMAAFARSRHKDFGVTERTLYGWVRNHRKNRE